MSAAAKQWRVATVAEMHRLAAFLARQMRRGEAVLVEGTLGAGKTEFARGFIHALGDATLDVTSPTFALLQPYDIVLGGAVAVCWHADLYRIEAPEELAELGLETLAEEGVLCIEWPDRLADSVARDGLRIKIMLAPEGADRMVSLEYMGRFVAQAHEITDELDRQFTRHA